MPTTPPLPPYRQGSTPKDPKDTVLNGFILGIAVPILGYAILWCISWLLAKFVIANWSGFSERFLYIVAIVFNFIPFNIYIKQRRDTAIKGIILATFILIFTVIYKFRDVFLA